MKNLLSMGMIILVCWPAEAKTVDRILAQVNDDIITLSELNREMAPYLRDLETKYTGNQLEQAIKKTKEQVLDSLIEQRLILQKAAEIGAGENVDAEVSAALQRIIKDNNLKDMDDLESALENEGRSLREFRETIRKRVIISSMIDSFVRSRIAIMPEEVEKYYKDHAADFSIPEEVALSEIIIRGGEDIKGAESRANDLYRRSLKGESFAALASQYSQGPTANRGGSIGTNVLSKWGSETVSAIAGLKEGEISKPMKFRDEYVIYRVDTRRYAAMRPLNEVRDEIKNRIYERKFEPEYDKFIEQLKEDAYIQDYSDTN